MSDDNPFLVDAFFVSHDNYAARKKEIRNLTLELALIAHHIGVSLPDYGFTIKGNGKIYQWDPMENDMLYEKNSWMEHYKNLAKNTGSQKKIEEEATKIWEAMYTNLQIPGLTYTRSKDNTTQKMSGKIELHNILTSHPISKEESLCDAIWDRISVRDNLISERTRLAAELKIKTNQIKELVKDCNECETAKESLQENIEKLKTENAILQKMHATQTEEQEKLTEQITDLEGELSDMNRTQTHYQEEEQKYKTQIFNFEQEIENLKKEIVDYKNSEESKIEIIKKKATEVAEELIKKTTDQYESKFDELKQTSDAVIAKLKKEISELKKMNKQPKK